MSSIEFPSNPTTGTVYVSTTGVTYTYDGVKWLGQAQKGSQGFQGFQGVQGAAGAQGSQGYQGFQGIQGAQGYQGLTGAQGSQGYQGFQGFQGFQGAQGFQGSQGYQGFQGFQGAQGFQGLTGVDLLEFVSGTGTQVVKVLNTVTIWSTANLQQVTEYGNQTTSTVFIDNATESTNTQTGALIVSGGVGIGGNLNLGKILSLNQVQESFITISGATGTVEHNATQAKIFYHTNIANTFTVNVTNLSLNSGFSTVVVLMLNHGAVAYLPRFFEINGINQNIVWQGGITPIGISSTTSVLSYTILNNAGNYTVLGQLVPFG